MFDVEWELDDKTVKNIHQAFIDFLLGKGETLSGSEDENIIEAHITNRQQHVIIAEFGSGIYGEGQSNHTTIVPTGATALLIPISSKYSNNISAATWLEGIENAQRHPDILAKIKGEMPGVVGFIFRKSIKGMRPIRMVRDSIPKAGIALEREIAKAFSGKKVIRQQIAIALNTVAAIWLRAIIKKTPVLTSNLKTGWTISRFAK